MARILGRSTSVAAPPAARVAASGWRDPRLWVGVAIVALSIVAGSRVLASADDTVAIWAVASDVGAGERLSTTDLEARRVHFADEEALAGYVTVETGLPADAQLTRGLAAGELLPRAALGTGAASDLLQVPVAVDPEQVPPSVGSGAVVDVYLLAASSRKGTGGAAPALAGVTVLDAPPIEESFGTSGQRQLVLAVPEPDVQRFFGLVDGLENPVITVVRRG